MEDYLADNIIHKLADEALDMNKTIINLAVKYNLQNKQWFIDWLDDLNKLSIEY